MPAGEGNHYVKTTANRSGAAVGGSSEGQTLAVCGNWLFFNPWKMIRGVVILAT